MLKTTFTIEEMRHFAREAWGPLGVYIVERWEEYNARYFGGKLRPVPLVVTNTQPYGRSLAFCSYGGGRTITVNVPQIPGVHGGAYRLLADNGVLLHEMIHQFLFEAGVDASHESDGWREEIMRLSLEVAGVSIWAGRSITKRIPTPEGPKKSKVIRTNEDGPNGEKSITQGQIATWPHSVGITCLGAFEF